MLVIISLLADGIKALRDEVKRWRSRAHAAEKAVRLNHEWHREYDDTGTYEDSELYERNLAVFVGRD
jgi:hypothetical protein